MPNAAGCGRLVMIQVPEQEGENDDTERERKTGAGDPLY